MSQTKIFNNFSLFDLIMKYKGEILCFVLFLILIKLDFLIGCYVVEYFDGKELHQKQHERVMNYFDEFMIGFFALTFMITVIVGIFFSIVGCMVICRPFGYSK